MKAESKEHPDITGRKEEEKTFLFDKCGAVIMASGEGKRFGANKLMAVLKEKPLISHVMEKTKTLGIDSVVVTRNEEVQSFCEKKGQNVIFHDLPGRNDTTRLGTEYFLQRGDDFILFLQGDQPFVSCDSLMAMMMAAKASPDKIVRLSFNGTDVAPVLFPRVYFDDLRSLPEGKGGGAIIRRNPEKVLRVEAKAEWETWDIDTREDLDKCRAL